MKPVTAIGNLNLVQASLFDVHAYRAAHRTQSDRDFEIHLEKVILDGRTLVIDLNRLDAEDGIIAGVVPLRWGAPRIIVVRHGKIAQEIQEGNEPHRRWRLWRYAWDGKTDLALITRRVLKLDDFPRLLEVAA